MRARWLACVITAWCVPVAIAAQAALSDAALFADAQAKERAVRQALEGPLGAEAVLRAVRTVVGDYQSLTRRYPESTYSDDALWHAAMLSLEAFQRYGDPHDQAMATGLLRRLELDYPDSPLARKAANPSGAETTRASGSSPSPNAVTTTASRAATPAPPSSAPRIVTISAIERTVLPGTVRVTITLNGEAPFREERLVRPDRYYVDLSGVQLGPRLSDGTLRFDGDGHPVRQVRIGRHPKNVVRVVLDAAGTSTCSAYPLYSPHRLVLECVTERSTPARTTTTAVPRPFPQPAPRTATPAPPVSSASPAPALQPPPPAVPVSLEPLAPLMPLAAVEASPVPSLLAARTADAALRLVMPARLSSRADLFEGVSPASAKPTAPVNPLPPSRNIAGGFSLARQLGLGVSRIVIDPGHGGQDPGARASGITEAEITLDIALRLEKLFETVPGVEVILTRRSDVFLSLEERTAIANRESADLFLSIHVNGSNNRQASGVETYFLNFATTQAAAAVAARENATSGQSMAELPQVVRAIAANNKRDESRDLATQVQRELVGYLRRANSGVKDLGVKQAPFVVLIGAEMPSVLAEVSFLTNAQEARLLKTAGYRQRIAQGLFNAIRKYQSSLKTGAVALQ